MGDSRINRIHNRIHNHDILPVKKRPSTKKSQPPITLLLVGAVNDAKCTKEGVETTSLAERNVKPLKEPPFGIELRLPMSPRNRAS